MNACAGSMELTNPPQDSSRLPEGMKRVGYDSDTGRYYFRDRDGSLWEGPQGAEYGEMRRGRAVNLQLRVRLSSPTIMPKTTTRKPRSASPRLVRMGTDLSPSTWYVNSPAPALADLHANEAREQDGSTHARHTTRTDSAYRVILPFFLIVAAVLLLVFRLVHSSTPVNPPETLRCPGASEAYTLVRGDTCWELSQTRGCTVQDILNANDGLKCEALRPGQAICLPPPRAT
ncbi:hypothetical protein ACG7TL_000060 [Trametes sanguinea]